MSSFSLFNGVGTRYSLFKLKKNISQIEKLKKSCDGLTTRFQIKSVVRVSQNAGECKLKISNFWQQLIKKVVHLTSFA
jgi:hypothetical protein